jgi:hypothetical protein
MDKHAVWERTSKRILNRSIYSELKVHRLYRTTSKPLAGLHRLRVGWEASGEDILPCSRVDR